MALDSSQLVSLLSVLSEDNTNTQTLEAIANSFHQFFAKQEFFKIGCALVALLQNKDLVINPTQRIVCVYFLYDMYRSDPISLNPFVSVFTSLLSPPVANAKESNLKEFNWHLPKLTPQEKYFVSQLITSPSKDLFKKTATQILQMEASNLNIGDISGLQVSIAEKLSELPHLSKIDLPCIISDSESNLYGYDETVPKNGSEQQKQCIETLLVGHDAPFRKCVKPEFIRLAPPLHVEQDELVWLDEISYMPDFMWDSTILSSTNTSLNIAEIRKLMTKACSSQLTITESQNLETNLTHDSSLIFHLDMTPAKFSNLVEHNPSIAVKSLLCFQGKESNDLSSYLDELFKMRMSVHSLEVVNNLANQVILPDDFIHYYIATCISKCESMNDEKQLQHRLVRLLCAFIQNLIKSKIIDAKDLQVELNPFCIEFSAIREANQLYRTLNKRD
ncbi:unnamed protein product [Brachionus calyciflorus]|uniref:CCR4-NOT transcription complex subunit 11 n=1 Tax=Brachionus calyciflorus TaxID=104777 RepID=A0A813ZZ21_9BILA|nr:unnamed protein product [Brachionus calyciflorus]